MAGVAYSSLISGFKKQDKLLNRKKIDKMKIGKEILKIYVNEYSNLLCNSLDHDKAWNESIFCKQIEPDLYCQYRAKLGIDQHT